MDHGSRVGATGKTETLMTVKPSRGGNHGKGLAVWLKASVAGPPLTPKTHPSLSNTAAQTQFYKTTGQEFSKVSKS